MKIVQYPQAYLAAATAARSYQQKHIFWKRLEFISIVIAALFAVSSFIVKFGNSSYNVSAALSGVSLLAALLVIFFEKAFNYKDGWFKCRAFAEAVKAESWRFRTACGMYGSGCSDRDAVVQFNGFLCRLRESLNITKYIAGFNLLGEEVTEEMRSARCMDIEERVENYRRNRVEEQAGWYNTNANRSEKKNRRFFYAAVFFILAGIIIAVFQFMNVFSQYSLIGVFSAAAASISGWMQVRRYEMLTITYATAAGELNAISQTMGEITETPALCETVSDAEVVISKEHTIWVRTADIDPM